MSHCTTWHIRIDLVDDGTDVAARAKLIGAPMAMTRQQPEGPHDGCLTGSHDLEHLSKWHALKDLTPVLVDALSLEHRAHSTQPVLQATDPAASDIGEPRPEPGLS